VSFHKHSIKGINTAHYLSFHLEFYTVLNKFFVECLCVFSLFMLMHGTKYQQCSSFVLGFGVPKLLITLNSSDCLKVYSVPDSIVHHTLQDVYDPLIVDHRHSMKTDEPC
jgi:hypothetical protein